MRLQTRDDADRQVALTRQRADGRRDRAGGDAGDLAEQAAPVQAIGAPPLRDGEHDLTVRHGREEGGVQPLRPDREALGVAARAEIPALAREREQVFVPAGVTADAGEAVLQDPTGEELVGHLRDDEPPGAVLPSEAFVIDRLVPPLSQGRQRLRETSESFGAYSAT